MAVNRYYRVERPIAGVHWQKSGKTRMTLPSGAIIEPLASIADGARVIGVKWEGTIVMMLLRDLQQHATAQTA